MGDLKKGLDQILAQGCINDLSRLDNLIDHLEVKSENVDSLLEAIKQLYGFESEIRALRQRLALKSMSYWMNLWISEGRSVKMPQ